MKKKKPMKNVTAGKQDLRTGYIFLSFITIITMLFFAYNNSPFVERMGEDGGIFLLMGRNLAEGGTLYKDLFDHKGSVIFFLNALPQLFVKGTVGVWILEIIFMAMSLCLLYKTAYKLLKNPSAILPPLLYLIISGLLFNGGNYTEEYSNLFSIIALYIFVTWMESRETKISQNQGVILGISLAIVFFTRPNNIVFIISVIAYIGISLLKGNIKQAFNFAAMVIVGISIITGIIVIYHIQQHTLGEMIYATVLHNLDYCREGIRAKQTIPLIYNSFKKWMLLINAFVGYSIIRCFIYKNRKYGVFLILASITTVISIFISGREFQYYLLLETPVMALSSILILVHGTKDLKEYLKKEWKKAVLLNLIVLGLIINFGKNPVRIKANIQSYKEACIELSSYIPIDEQKEVFGYDVPAMWYYITDITPCYKFYTMQEWMAKTNPKIKEDINAFVLKEQPKWIIAYNEAAGTNHNLMEELLKNYELIYHNESGYLYRAKA